MEVKHLLLACLVTLGGCSAHKGPQLARGYGCPKDSPRIEVPHGCYVTPDNKAIQCPTPKTWYIKCGEEVKAEHKTPLPTERSNP